MIRTWVISLALSAIAVCSYAESRPFTDEFGLAKEELSSTGRNTYFVLEPGYQLSYVSKKGSLVIKVLGETTTIDGVEVRVVEEREMENGKLVEVSRNYFAISKKTNCVFYFGEDVDMYDKNGAVKSHEGSWRAGVGGAKPGLVMPGRALLGARYYQELAPNTAMDRSEITSVSESLKVPAGTYGSVLKVEETTPLEPRSKEFKWYAPGVGLIKDGDMELVQFGAGQN